MVIVVDVEEFSMASSYDESVNQSAWVNKAKVGKHNLIISRFDTSIDVAIHNDLHVKKIGEFF